MLIVLVIAYTMRFGTLKSTRVQMQKHTDKKENKIFLVYKEIQMGSGANPYMRKRFLIYEEMRKFFTMYSMRRPLDV
jgi:hypothetical protein